MTSSRQTILTLVVVALLCSVILSFVYSFTTPRIAETKRNMTIASLNEVIDAKEFVELIPDTLWQANDSLNNPAGIVFRVFPQGYSAPIPIMVGLDAQGKITGIRVASASEGLKETPGLGSKITDREFTEQFKGKSAATVGIKKDGGEIDAITAATISSRAVSSGVKDGIEKYSDRFRKNEDIKCKIFPEAHFAEIEKSGSWCVLGNNDTLGMIIQGATLGYVDSIKYLVGIDRKGNVVGVEILYSKETPGIGEKIKDKEFLDQFKTTLPEAITGATKSSQVLIDAIRKDLFQYREYFK